MNFRAKFTLREGHNVFKGNGKMRELRGRTEG